MTELKLIYGRRSEKYNHFEEYELAGCRAVAARLMGVVALKLTWQGKDDKRARFFQVMHLDYSEYGIDDYQEFECIPGSPEYASQKEEMNGLWNHFIAVMGSEVVTIDDACMLRLVSSAMKLAEADLDREYDNEENRRFREYASLRLGFMRDTLACRGITEADCSLRDAIETASPVRLSAYETINYFVMRIVDHDFDAAAILTALGREALEELEITRPGIQTLVKCDIEKAPLKRGDAAHEGSYPFNCRITTLGRDRYYHATFRIWLSGNYRSKNPMVTDIKIGSLLPLSDYEAAMQIDRAEYITVFGCSDSMLNGFDPKHIGPLANSAPQAVANGWLYTAYKPNNSHVDSPHYRMDDDVYGYALLSIPGELVLMSPDLRNISMLDDAAIFSLYSPFISAKGRYKIDSSVFQTLCRSQGALFEDLVVPEGD